MKLIFKIALIGFLSIMMLIPLAMIRGQIRDRQYAADSCKEEVAKSWGLEQTLKGVYIGLRYNETKRNAYGKEEIVVVEEKIYPETLKYVIDTDSEELHRSIYDVMVYKANVHIESGFVIPQRQDAQLKDARLYVGLSDLRGIDGDAEFMWNGEKMSFNESVSGAMVKDIVLPPDAGASAVPMVMDFKLRGMESIKVRPYGSKTEVTMTGDCPDPSFIGDFLPTERDVRPDGFTATWSVSEINRGDPDEVFLGTKMLGGVSQYQMSMRTAKYGILIVLLVFIAGLAVELITRKGIHIIQYLVIGLSLVLFYALVLSFSEVMAFWMAYGLATLMTAVALTCYFRAILKDKSAYLLGLFVAVAYMVCFVLLQMENFAFLTGTLLLFVMLAAVMYVTRNINNNVETSV